MAEGEQFHADATEPPSREQGGRLLRRTTAGLVVLVLGVAGAAYPLDLGERLGLAADPQPAEIAPPSGLELPAARSAPLVATPDAETAANPTAVARAIRELVRAPVLGRRVSVAVADVGSSRPIYTAGAAAVTPASTLKLLTVTAALEALGADHRFTTSVVRAGRRVVLIGGGDPLLTRTPSDDDAYPQQADLTTLARITAAALDRAGVKRVGVGYDTSLFDGPAVERTWEPDYVPENVVSPISSLWVDEGRERAGYSGRSADPALAAAQFFSAALRKRGIDVVGSPRLTTAPSTTPFASVEGAPLSQVVQHVLELSDNEGAEVLARHVAISQGEPASFSGGVTAVRRVLSALGVRFTGARVYDGSGLSRANRLGRITLIDVLRVTATDPDLRPVLTGLPVAGFSGSLAYRFEMAPRVALGEVRAKTGTLSGVHGLAGTVRTRDGVVLAFVAIADRVRDFETLLARSKLDQLAGALAACTCG